MLKELLETLDFDCLNNIKKLLDELKANKDDVIIDTSEEKIIIPVNISLQKWKRINKDYVLDVCNAIAAEYLKLNFFYDEEIKKEILQKVKNPKGVVIIEFNELPDMIKNYF